ncbi:hypothetical protein OC834_005833 [Tilletia horrida]|nr:hypothetical protein OC834_005833 [Tilletia horrida]
MATATRPEHNVEQLIAQGAAQRTAAQGGGAQAPMRNAAVPTGVGAASDTPWRLPPLSGIPAPVQAHAEILRGAYLNAGRLNGGLARLHAASELYAHATERKEKAAQRTTKTIAATLSMLEQDVVRRLRQSQTRFEDEVGALKARMQDEVTGTNSAVVQQLRDAVAVIEGALADKEGDLREELEEAWRHLCLSRTELEREISSTEETYMGSLSQLVMFNSWTAAWPEALRAAQHVHAGSAHAPPSYSRSGAAPLAEAGAAATGSAM